MYAGIDLGGTNIAVGLTDLAGTLLKKTSVPLGSAKADPSMAADKMAEALKSLGGEIEAVGIGSPGIVDPESGRVVFASNIAFSDYPLVSEMEKRLGKKCVLINDGNAAALAECRLGAAKDYKNVVMMTLGTGVGGGIIIDRKVYTGSLFGAGEVGHMVIEKGGRKCACGRRGCFEQYASATGLVKTSRMIAEKYPNSLLAKEEINAMTAFRLAREGDAASREAVCEFIGDLAEGTANIITLFSPDAVVIGGGVSNEGEPLFSPLREKLREILPGDKTPIVRALLGSDAGIIGAALAAM